MSNVISAIETFFGEAKNPVLFAGAGVSARAGLPDWKNYLTQIIDAARKDDPTSAALMTKLTSKGEYDRAISVLMLSTDIREGDKYKFITTPLKDYNENALLPLVGLPFSAIVTTNFDLAIIDAYSKAASKPALNFSVDDDSLRAALFEDNVFIARIHGRVEVPSSVVLSKEKLDDLVQKPSYLAFLEHVFTQRQVLFIGFSFFDPAIQTVFRAIDHRIGVITKGKHVALVPEGATSNFQNQLEHFNIKRISYSFKQNHEELWEGIANVRVQAEQVRRVQRPTSLEPMEIAKKYLAACYARAKLGSGVTPLRRTVIEGIVGQIIHGAGTSGIELDRIKTVISKELRIREDQIGPVIDEAIAGLQRGGLLRFGSDENAKLVFWLTTGQQIDGLDQAIGRLVDAAINRYIIRERGQDSPEARLVLHDFFLLVGLRRGWDLGAAFASRRSVEDLQIEPLMHQCGAALGAHAVEGLVSACNDLFRHPDNSSAEALVTLGRASFGLEMVIQAPRDALFHAMTLPQQVYFDANILLPAITVGHPFHDQYEKTINRLSDASAQSMGRVRLLVYEGFLNEIVSHRRLAKDHISKLGADEARDMARLYGTTNVNVFIGAFANLNLNDPTLSFDRFLSRYAPYETERDLIKWLSTKQITVVHGAYYTGAETQFGNIYHRLEVIFADQVARGYRTGTTVRHDAVQLSVLHEDLSKGKRAILVSADRRLRDGLRDGPFSYLGNSIIDGLGLSQMIDLLVGNPGDDSGLASLYWTTHVSSEANVVRSYFIDKALDEYDEATAMQIGDVVDSISEEVASEAKRIGIDLIVGEGQRAIEAMRLVGTFEDRFYEELKKIRDRRQRDEA